MEFLQKNKNFKYFFKKTQKFLWNMSEFGIFSYEKMDFVARKNVAIFEKWIHFLILWIVFKNETSLPSGGPSPPDPLRWRLPSRFPLIPPPRSKILEPPMTRPHGKRERERPCMLYNKCGYKGYVPLIEILIFFSANLSPGSFISNSLSIGFSANFIILEDDCERIVHKWLFTYNRKPSDSSF